MTKAVQSAPQMASSALREALPNQDAGFLWDFWYPALRSSEIEGRKPVTAMLLEVSLVLVRTSEQQVFAMRDACHHRGIPLSYAILDGQALKCGYHGSK